MHAIVEQELLDYASNNVLKAFTVRETAEGRFTLIVSVTWREGDCILTSARKNPRFWASLNTLTKYIKDLNKPDIPIQLVLYHQERPS